ncbi:MAG TPA: NUDIX domain-containing protein [Flavitalea sp.]|nr:NUDIX domain-containing protein [Flavitalea sp.]
MVNQSAGILLYRRKSNRIELFLVHPGGPFWQKKDQGAWTIPKGEFTDNEEALEAARREFEEETGVALSGNFIELTPVKQKAGKLIYAWALEGDVDASNIFSNSFKIEWPPKSGRYKEFPEVDKAEWFGKEQAKEKINPAQARLVDELLQKLE